MLRRATGLSALTLLAMLAVAVPGARADVIDCPAGTTASGGYCTITVTDPGTDGGDGGSDATQVDHKDGGEESKTCEDAFGNTIDCTSSYGTWNGTCYVKVSDPQPSKDDPLWEGHDDGVIVDCTSNDRNGGLVYVTSQMWMASAPGATADPRAVAQTAVEKMNLIAGDIGITPRGGDMGYVGMPTWLWVSNPGESTVGPITRSASAGGVTVTATGRLDRIVWSMGDGATVTCEGGGTAYTAAAGSQSSPTCGHTYTETSAHQIDQAYTITATSYWTITWSGGGQSGTIPLDFSRSVQHKVGEIQVLITKGND